MARRTTRKASAPVLEAPRIRFNWGFWDGTQHARMGWGNRWAGKTHFDPAYKTGFCIGYAEYVRGERHETSEACWREALNYGDVTE